MLVTTPSGVTSSPSMAITLAGLEICTNEEERALVLLRFGRAHLRRILLIQRYWRTWGALLARLRARRRERAAAVQLSAVGRAWAKRQAAGGAAPSDTDGNGDAGVGRLSAAPSLVLSVSVSNVSGGAGHAKNAVTLAVLEGCATEEERFVGWHRFGRAHLRRILFVQRYWRTWGSLLARLRARRRERASGVTASAARRRSAPPPPTPAEALAAREAFARGAIEREARRALFAAAVPALDALEAAHGAAFGVGENANAEREEAAARRRIVLAAFPFFVLEAEARSRGAIEGRRFEDVAWLHALATAARGRLGARAARRPPKLAPDAATLALCRQRRRQQAPPPVIQQPSSQQGVVALTATTSATNTADCRAWDFNACRDGKTAADEELLEQQRRVRLERRRARPGQPATADDDQPVAFDLAEVAAAEAIVAAANGAPAAAYAVAVAAVAVAPAPVAAFVSEADVAPYVPAPPPPRPPLYGGGRQSPHLRQRLERGGVGPPGRGAVGTPGYMLGLLTRFDAAFK